MKKLLAPIAFALVLAACEPAVGDQDIENLEADIRRQAGEQGLNVKQVELAKAGDRRVTGHAIVEPRAAPGVEIRWNCSADLDDNSQLQWRCAP